MHLTAYTFDVAVTDENGEPEYARYRLYDTAALAEEARAAFAAERWAANTSQVYAVEA